MSSQVWEGLESSQGNGMSAPSSQEPEPPQHVSSQDDSFKLARNPSLLRNGFMDMLQDQDSQARGDPVFRFKKMMPASYAGFDGMTATAAGGAPAPSGAALPGAELLSGLANASEGEAPMPPRIDIQAQARAPMMQRQGGLGVLSPGQHNAEPEAAALEHLFRAASDDLIEVKVRLGTLGMAPDDPRRLDLPPVCDRCRRLHRKCDRAMPCSECRMRNSNCVTSSTRASSGPQGGRPPKAAKKLAMEQRRQQQQQLLQQQQQLQQLQQQQQQSQQPLLPQPQQMQPASPFPKPAEVKAEHKLPEPTSAYAPIGQRGGARESALKKTRLGDDSPGIGIHEEDEEMLYDGESGMSPEFEGGDGVQIISVAQVHQINPEALMPFETSRVSLSDVTLAFLPSGTGGLSVCDSCVRFNKRCDRRAPCSECIVDGKPDQCTRPSNRREGKVKKQRNPNKVAQAAYHPRY